MEEVPELDAEGGVGAVALEEGGEAFGTAAALGVGGAPEGRHRGEGIAEGGSEGAGATGVAQRLADATEQGGAARLEGGPGGRAVLVVESAELIEQGRIGVRRDVSAGVRLGGCPGGGPRVGAWVGAAAGPRGLAAGPMGCRVRAP